MLFSMVLLIDAVLVNPEETVPESSHDCQSVLDDLGSRIRHHHAVSLASDVAC